MTQFVSYATMNKKTQGIYAKIAPTQNEFGQSSAGSGTRSSSQISANLQD